MVCGRVLRPPTPGFCHGTAFQLDLERACNGRGDLILEVKHILQITIVLVRPKLVTAVHVGEFSRDAHVFTDFLEAAFEDHTDVELPADFAHVLLAAKLKGGCSRSYTQGRQLRKKDRKSV